MSNERLTLDWYEEKAQDTNQYKDVASIAMGLGSEAGEVLGKVAKCIRDNNGVIDEDIRIAIGYEVSDVLWHIPVLANALGFTFQEIAEMNVEKLASRKKRGKINGEGDNR